MENQNKDADLRLELRFKNARLWHAIYDRWGSVAAFCKATNNVYCQHVVGGLISLKGNPIHKRYGKPTEAALWLSNILNIPFGELFPPYLYEDRVPSLRVVELCGEDVLSLQEAENQGLLPASIQDHDYYDLKEKIKNVLHTLSAREEQVIHLRFMEGMTLQDIGKEMNLTKERVRQIEVKALRKLRHPSRRCELGRFLEGSDI